MYFGAIAFFLIILALGYKDTSLQASIGLKALALGKPNRLLSLCLAS